MASIESSHRNMGLDFLKYICAFLVICIHASYVGKEYITPITRIAVPIFFMISGYYHRFRKEKGRSESQIKKILQLLIAANLIHMLWALLLACTSADEMQELMYKWSSRKTWADFLVWNESPFRSHLWYLGALLYVLVFVSLFEHRWDIKKLYVLIPILFAANLILGNYSTVLLGDAPDVMISRNFLFIGLPCYLLGDLIHERKEIFARISNKSLLTVLIATLFTAEAERAFLATQNAYINQDFFVSTIFSAISAFCLANNNADLFEEGIPKKIASMGKTLSLYIYVFQSVIKQILTKIVEIGEQFLPMISNIFSYLSPFIVLIVSTVVAWSFSQVSQKLKIQKKY